MEIFPKNPKVSIIIPTYNQAHHIREAINSVLDQTFKDFEVIIVDDGSKDNTRDVLKSYIDKNLVQYIFQDNQGAAGARNLGIELARGEYITFLDADDILLPDSLKKRVITMENYQEISLAFSDYYITTKKNETMNDLNPIFKERNMLLYLRAAIYKQCDDVYLLNSSYYRIALRMRGLFPSTGAVMIKRQCFNEIGDFDENLKIAEDLDMWLRLLRKYKAGYINQPLFIYKKYNSNLTKNKELYHISTIKMLQKLEQEKDSEVVKAIQKRLGENYFALGWYCLNNRSLEKAGKYFMKCLKYNFLSVFTSEFY